LKSGVVLPLAHTEPHNRSVMDPNSSVANNDSKQVLSVMIPVFEWRMSVADMQIVENEIRKDEERERNLMFAEDSRAHKDTSIHHTASARQQYHQQQLNLQQQFNAGHKRNQLQAEVDLGALEPEEAKIISNEIEYENASVPDQVIRSTSHLDNLMAMEAVKKCIIVDPQNNMELRVNPQQRQHEIELRMIQSASGSQLQPVVRPAVLVAIEHDMHGYSFAPTIRRVGNFLVDLRQSFLGLWRSNQVTPE
jgi:hypothetical protein